MLEPYLPDDPRMQQAWVDCLRWSITQPKILAALRGAAGGSVAKFDFGGKIQKSCIRNSMSYRLPNVKFRRTQYPHHKNQHIPDKSAITSPMQSTHPNVNSISDLATGNGNDATPFSQQSVVLTKQAYIELTWKANYWQAQHARSVEREAALTAKVDIA